MLIIPPSTAGQSVFCPYLSTRSASTSARWAAAGAWTRRISRSKAYGKYLYRVVDKEGKTVDFLLTARRDKAAALRFFEKTMKANSVAEKAVMDQSGGKKAAMDEINARGESQIII